MIYILLSWLYLFIVATAFGIVYKRLLKINTYNTSLHQILGLFAFTLFTSTIALFFRIHIEFYSITLLCTLFIILTNKTHFTSEIKAFYNTIAKLQRLHKTLFFTLFFLTLAKSSTIPYVIDNDSYYAQTIKWINEYGYVKGLANLHTFFAQNSGWHTLQAASNFSFLTDRLNDNNGFLFILFSLLAISSFQNKKLLHNTTNSTYILLLLFTPLFMQFINAPSPDLILFLLTPLIFYLFIENYTTPNENDFGILLSLVLFLCFVKVTVAVLPIFIVILFVKHYHVLKPNIIYYTGISLSVLLLFVAKNYIITGYELFPIKGINLIQNDWELPKSLINFYKKGTYLSGFNNQEVKHLDFLNKFWFWLQLPKLHGMFNKLYIVLLAIFPFIILKKSNKPAYSIIYSLAIIHFIMLWYNSPQYRFFLMFIIFFLIELFSELITTKKWHIPAIWVNTLATTYILLFGLNLKHFTSNKFTLTLSQFQIKNIIVPEKNAKTNSGFTKEHILNFKFNSPPKDAFFWSTGLGDLPCVNKKQIEYFKTYYKLIPELRGTTLKEGFISKTVN